MKIEELKKVFQTIYNELEEKKDFLSLLDQNIGDGDHGVNIVRGFKEVIQSITTEVDLSSFLSIVGRTLMSKVGGASGPLYGMAFINAANNLKNKTELGLEEFKILVKSFSASLEMLGKVKIGEKTMYDVWKPLSEKLDSINEINEKNKLELIDFVNNSALATKDLIATKGRASYLKERSKGTIDPGSASSNIILANIIKEL
ncbi:dihydroxyacetone kinase subunit DhaL [Mesomycoplasma molare]|uniref:Dihydroxyacetone kinase subunit DhaL n=1 Tax=Mesomycoplasma molare TaxID=171288 RepID=A0ABY5TYE9_9BACT|nr:dihydroxyacetone kinase subunit DhaL [Mesomycoplasma molare]UWD34551.1 dihydroxyacetone kinase subunit DhaL [Mesomycoplasma molare]